MPEAGNKEQKTAFVTAMEYISMVVYEMQSGFVAEDDSAKDEDDDAKA